MEEHFLGKVATKAIIVKDGKVLIVRDHKDDAMWDLPGGRINIGENIEDALRREIMEELGVEINIKSVIYSSQRVHTSEGSSHLFIYCEVTVADPSQSLNVPSEELAEVKWIDKDTVNEVKMYGDCMDAIKAYWKL